MSAVIDMQQVSYEIKSLIETGEREKIRDILSTWTAPDIALLMVELDNEEQHVFVFNALPNELAISAFEYCELAIQINLLENIAEEKRAEILNKMPPDDRTTLFSELPPAEVTEMLQVLNPEERKISLTLLGYPEHSIGRLMTPDYVAVRKEWTVQQVLNYIRRHGRNSETLDIIYIVDEKGHLMDDIRIRELLLADPNTLLKEILDDKYIALKATQDQEEAIKIFKDQNRVALPVIDSNGLLLGIVTVDDVFEIARQEDTEDIQKFGGSEALDLPYVDTSFRKMVQKRAGWLIVLFLSEMLTATAMAGYEDEIAKLVILSIFLPLIISSGGNSGSQAATLIIRAMALGEIKLRDWWFVMRREIMAGFSLGCILGVIGFIRISLWHFLFHSYSVGINGAPLMAGTWFLLAITIGVSLIGVVMWGTIAGSMLPIVLKRLGADPATSSAPFIATLVDVTGLIIYFTIAAIIMRGVMM